MKNRKRLRRDFGLNEWGLIGFPNKISNRKVSRSLNCRARGGCSICFPHGYETTNSRYYKIQRSWKTHRKTQWR